MNFFNLDHILCLIGMVFGIVSQLLVWIYMIASARRVSLPEYDTFRTNVNLSFLFTMLILSFMRLSRTETAGYISILFMVIHLAAWVLTLMVSIIMLAFCRNSRENLKSAMSACLFKTMLTTLALWVIV